MTDAPTPAQRRTTRRSHTRSRGQRPYRRSNESRAPRPPDTAIDHLNRLFSDPSLCTWCLDRKRIPYPEWDEARINAKDRDRKNSGAINHFAFTKFERNDDGSLEVIKASSGRDPRTWKETVPEKKKPRLVNGEYRLSWEIEETPRAKTICSDCAEVDVDPTETRPNAIIFTALENVAEHYEREDRAFSHRAAKGMAEHLLEKDTTNYFSSADRDLLAFALDAGFRYAAD